MLMNNPAIDCLLSRRSVKAYLPDMPPRETLQAILAAGMNAPTGRNRQSPYIVAVTDSAVRNRLSEMNREILGSDHDPFYGAPAALVVLADNTVPTCIYDGSLVMGNLQNAAHALGLGSCWIHRAKEMFQTPEGRALLAEWGLPEQLEGIGICIVGYAAGPLPAERPRKQGYCRFV